MKHQHESDKALINRMSKAIGHMEAIKKMIDNNRDCAELLIQLSAVRSAINNIGKLILQDHLEHCVMIAIEKDNKEVLVDLNKAINQFLK